MTIVFNRQLAFLFVVVLTCVCSTTVAQKGLADALSSAGKTGKSPSDENPIDESSWTEESPFSNQPQPGGTADSADSTSQNSGVSGGKTDDTNNSGSANEESRSTEVGRPDKSKVKSKGSEAANSQGALLDARIRRLQEKIDRLQQKRDSKQVLHQISSVENARKVADRYRELTAREVQHALNQNEPWRKPLVDSLRRQMTIVDNLVQEIAAERPQAGSIAEQVALNRLNHALLDVYLAALRLRLAELKWMREAQYPTFEVAVKPKTLSLHFISWENSPGLEELVADRVGIVESLKEVKERMSAGNRGAVSMLATLQLNLKVHLWEFEDRFLEVVFTSAHSPIPVIPEEMKEKAPLRMEASQTALALALLTYPLSAEDMRTLREKGSLEIDLSTAGPIRDLNHWVLTDTENAKIILIRADSDSQPIPNSSVNDRLGDEPQTETSDEKKVDSPTEEERGKTDPGKSDTTGPSKPDRAPGGSTGNDASTDTKDNDSQDETKPDDREQVKDEPGDKPQDDESDEDGSTLGFDAPADQRLSENEKQTEHPKNDVLSPDLDAKPNRSTSKPNSPSERGKGQESQTGSAQSVEGNWLSIKGVQRMPTERVQGFWKDSQTDVVEWFELTENRLIVRPTTNLRALGIDVYQRKNSNRYYGRAYTVPQNGNCTHVGFWQPAALRVSRGKARGTWKGKKVDEETCKLGTLPDGGALSFDRVMVTSFKPLANGKLMHVTAAPSVGNQRSQLKATAKIAVRLTDIPGLVAKVFLGRQLLQPSANDAEFDFTTNHSGRHELRVDILTSTGKILHQEDVRIDVPSISGIGN